MGKDKAKDKEQHDGETTASSETITSPQDACRDACQSNRDLGQDRKAQDAALAKTITKAVTREMAKACVHYQAILNERGTATIQTNLQEQMVSRLWIPSIGLRTNLSTKDGSYGQKRLDLPLMPRKVTQKGLKSLTSITGSMEKEWDTLSHGKTARPSSASLYMMH